MSKYTVFLFRSGRVWVQEGTRTLSQNFDQPLLTEVVDMPDERSSSAAFTAVPVLGKLLLKYVDRANQPHQHVCPPCERPHYQMPSHTSSPCQTCDGQPEEHTTMTHVYIPEDWTP